MTRFPNLSKFLKLKRCLVKSSDAELFNYKWTNIKCRDILKIPVNVGFISKFQLCLLALKARPRKLSFTILQQHFKVIFRNF